MKEEDVNGVVKNKNEDWSSVWSSLLPHSEFSERVQIPLRTLLKHTRTRGSTHVRAHLTAPHSNWDLLGFIILNVQPHNQVKRTKKAGGEGMK